MLQAAPADRGADNTHLEKRVRQEVEAALRSSGAKAAAAHVELANRYLTKLTNLSRADSG